MSGRNSASGTVKHMEVREELGMRPGGFGILLAQQLVDELIYDESGKEVFLVKYLDPHKPTAARNSLQRITFETRQLTTHC